MTLEEFDKIDFDFGDTITIVCKNGKSATGYFNDWERAHESDDGFDYIGIHSDEGCSLYARLDNIKEIIVVSRYRA